MTPIDLQAAAYRTVADVPHAAVGRDVPWWSVSPFGGGVDDGLDPDDVDRVTVEVKPAEAYRGETERALQDAARAARRRLGGRGGHRRATARPSASRSLRGAEGIAARLVERARRRPRAVGAHVTTRRPRARLRLARL